MQLFSVDNIQLCPDNKYNKYNITYFFRALASQHGFGALDNFPHVSPHIRCQFIILATSIHEHVVSREF